jgi:hypothetical protein
MAQCTSRNRDIYVVVISLMSQRYFGQPWVSRPRISQSNASVNTSEYPGIPELISAPLYYTANPV